MMINGLRIIHSLKDPSSTEDYIFIAKKQKRIKGLSYE